jgi:hypothetical protein
MKQLGYDPSDNSTDIETPTGIGNVACAAVLEFRHHDKSNQLGDLAQGPYSDWTGYTALNTPCPGASGIVRSQPLAAAHLREFQRRPDDPTLRRRPLVRCDSIRHVQGRRISLAGATSWARKVRVERLSGASSGVG